MNWTSIKKRLPKTNNELVVFYWEDPSVHGSYGFESGFMHNGVFCDESRYPLQCRDWVTHWSKLEPPRGKDLGFFEDPTDRVKGGCGKCVFYVPESAQGQHGRCIKLQTDTASGLFCGNYINKESKMSYVDLYFERRCRCYKSQSGVQKRECDLHKGG